MGINLTIFSKSNHNPLCFATDQTPEKLIVSVTGIEIGDLWGPGDPMPPNGNFYITKTGTPGQWQGANSKASNVLLHWFSNDTGLVIDVTGPITAFTYSSAIDCERWMPNDNDNAKGFEYWGGNAVIMTPSEMASAVETVVPVLEPKPFFEVFPGDSEIVDIRYANKHHRQNITIQFDTGELL